MPKVGKDEISYRCPSCLAETNDSVVLLYDPKKKEYYCTHCFFTGDRKEILRGYERFRAKYKDLLKRRRFI